MSSRDDFIAIFILWIIGTDFCREKNFKQLFSGADLKLISENLFFNDIICIEIIPEP